MRIISALLAFVLILAACGGGSDESGTTSDSDREVAGEASEVEEPSGDGTRLLVPGQTGIDVVDLDAESTESFIGDLGPASGLRLINGVLWFVDGTDLVAADASTGEVAGRVAVPNGVADLAVADNTAWALTGIPGASSEVMVIDTQTMTEVGVINAPESTTYLHVAAVGGSVWTYGGDIESATVASRLDRDSLTQATSVDMGLIARSMEAGGGGIWIGGTIPAFLSASGAPESGIAKIDGVTGEVLLSVELGEPADHIAVATGFDHVWATKGLDGTLYKIDPATGDIVSSADTGEGAAGIPLDISFTADAVWVFNTTDNTLTEYDPQTLEVRGGINVPPFSSAPIFAP